MLFERHIQLVFEAVSFVRHIQLVFEAVSFVRNIQLVFETVSHSSYSKPYKWLTASAFEFSDRLSVLCQPQLRNYMHEAHPPLFVLNNEPPASHRQTERVRIAITEIVSYLYSTVSKSFSLQRFHISLHRGKLHYDPFQKHNALAKLWGIRTLTENSCTLFAILSYKIGCRVEVVLRVEWQNAYHFTSR